MATGTWPKRESAKFENSTTFNKNLQNPKPIVRNQAPCEKSDQIVGNLQKPAKLNKALQKSANPAKIYKIKQKPPKICFHFPFNDGHLCVSPIIGIPFCSQARAPARLLWLRAFPPAAPQRQRQIILPTPRAHPIPGRCAPGPPARQKMKRFRGAPAELPRTFRGIPETVPRNTCA